MEAANENSTTSTSLAQEIARQFTEFVGDVSDDVFDDPASADDSASDASGSSDADTTSPGDGQAMLAVPDDGGTAGSSGATSSQSDSSSGGFDRDRVLAILKQLDPVINSYMQCQRIELTSGEIPWFNNNPIQHVQNHPQGSEVWHTITYDESLTDHRVVKDLLRYIGESDSFKAYKAKNFPKSLRPGMSATPNFKNTVDHAVWVKKAQGATEGEVSSAKFWHYGNEAVGIEGGVWTILNAAGAAAQVAPGAIRAPSRAAFGPMQRPQWDYVWNRPSSQSATAPVSTGSNVSVPGNLYLGPNDAFLRTARTVDPLPGYYDVAVHGQPRTVNLRTSTGTSAPIDHRGLAKLIQRTPDYQGEPIRLVSCSTGQHSDGFAQNLSNKLGVEVIAPSTLVWPGGSQPLITVNASGQIILVQGLKGRLTVSDSVSIIGIDPKTGQQLLVPVPLNPFSGQWNTFRPGGGRP